MTGLVRDLLPRFWQSAEEDTEAAQVRVDVFGRSSWGGGMTCLLWAIEEDTLDVAKVLVKYYPSLLNAGDTEGATPLHYGSW